MSWTRTSLRHLLTRTNDRNKTDLPLLSVVRERGVIMRQKDNHNIIPEDLSKYLVVSEGQFVINKMKAWQGSCGVSNFYGIVSPAYFVFNLHFENKRFFNYAIRSLPYKDEFARISSGIRVGQWDLSIQGLKEVIFTYPSPTEQDQIVRWLNWQTSSIAHYTRAKKREIECLRELKKSIISEAVTKGGDGWEMKSLRQLLRRMTVKNRPDMPLLSVVRERGVILREMDKSENHNAIPEDLSGNLLLLKGQFVINKMKAWQGSCAVSELDGIVSPAYFVFELRFKNKAFFNYAIRSAYYTMKFAQSSKGIRVGQWDLPIQELNNIQFLYPSAEEQERIVSYLDMQCAAIDELIAKLTREIELVGEYKASIISEAVTGKIDLRNVEIPDFEPMDEPENDTEEGIDDEDD